MLISAALLVLCGCAAHATGVGMRQPVVGAERTDSYLQRLHGKTVGIVANHTSTVAGRSHLLDTLLSLGVDVRAVFAPEHGFRGEAGAGDRVASYRDPKSGIDVISLYGDSRKPKADDIAALDIVLFDIQDVGLRYFTYISTMHYVMEACAENETELLILDRPNPNGMYVDGPVLDPKHRSFVGMHPIPVVHGMTLGELALMINLEGWLENGIKCNLGVITCENYTHRTRYELPVGPSPNLPDMRSVYLYPSLCFFEGTPVSLGRGTEFPFQVYGHPQMGGGFRFTPRSVPGAADPPLMDRLCHGVDLRTTPSNEEVIAAGVNLEYVIDAYNRLEMGEAFFTRMFTLLTGADYVSQMIIEGRTAAEIKARWQADLGEFRELRSKYLLYEE